MKFRFKVQQYQTDAVDSTVRVFTGQPYSNGLTYLRDLGVQPQKLALPNQQMRLFPDPQSSVFDEPDVTGYKNESVMLTRERLLQNIHAIQSENNIHLSERLMGDLGCCSLGRAKNRV